MKVRIIYLKALHQVRGDIRRGPRGGGRGKTAKISTSKPSHYKMIAKNTDEQVNNTQSQDQGNTKLTLNNTANSPVTKKQGDNPTATLSPTSTNNREAINTNKNKEHQTERIKIINHNSQGLKGKTKKRQVLKWAIKKKFDIMTLQETHIEDEDLDDWKDIWKGTILYSSGTNKSRGVTILISDQVEHEVLEEQKDTEGRWIIARIHIKGQELKIGNYYGPNEDNPKNIEEMLRTMDNMETEKVILAGDFNLVLNLNIDKHGGQRKTNVRCQHTLQSWMNNNNMTDIWRAKNPYIRKYTWMSNTKPKVMCRLDFFLISDNLQGYYQHTDIIPGFRSDHSCTTLTLKTTENKRGRGYWKFNSSLTKDIDLKDKLEKIINTTIEDNPNTDDCLLWDLIKCKMRGTCIAHSIIKNRRKRDRLQQLEEEISNLEELVQKDIIRGEEDTDYTVQLNTAKAEREEIISETTRGDAIRSKAQWHEEGDKAGKLFLNLEKARGECKTIRKIKDETGKIITESQGILETEEKYYQKLYRREDRSQPNHNISTEIWNTPGNTLEEEDIMNLTEEITEEELLKIIKTNPQNKSPGTDGLTNEFYLEYWQLIKGLLTRAINTGLKRGTLPLSQRRGIISLIPKPQKDLEELKNWRPITLLNQDYKLLTKAIANRIQTTLTNIISDDQSGFVKGRYIGCNIQRTQNLIELCEEMQEKAILVNIDFEKAFDTISWNFIYTAMEKLGYPENFIKWVKTLYEGIETCVINNGHSSKFFHPEKGVRQGCPLSPYLFIITTEIMNRWIKIQMENHGVKDSENNNYLISQFADDTSFAIRCNKESINKLFFLLKEFGNITGLKINIEKTEILIIGTTEIQDIPQKYRKLVKDNVKSLGCKIYKSQTRTTEVNIEEAVHKIKNMISKWNKRRMALSGKIAVIKSLLLPQVTYILSTMPSPNKEIQKELESLLFKFINKGGSDKIKRKILIGDYNSGGYKMVDLTSYIQSIKIRWMERLINTPGVWKKWVEKKCKVNLAYLARSNIKYKDLPFKFKKGSMWDEMWQEWCKENYKKAENIEEIMNQSLWFNSDLRINKDAVNWKKWEGQGIRWMADILEENNLNELRILKKWELEDRYGIEIGQLEYNSLLTTIPKEWKRQIRRQGHLNEVDVEEEKEDYKLIDKIQDNKRPLNFIYKKKIEKEHELPLNALNKWRRDLRITATNKEILKDHTENHWSILSNKLRSFNCNFLNRNVPTNRSLTIMKQKTDENCSFCGNKTKETLLHQYWECQTRKTIWHKLGALYQQATGKFMLMNKEKCLLGTGSWIPKSKKIAKLQRSICLLTKHYIHICKCNEDEKPTGPGLELYLKRYIRIERESARLKGCINKFEENWGGWSQWSDKRGNATTRDNG
jgi:exonuclease III